MEGPRHPGGPAKYCGGRAGVIGASHADRYTTVA